MDLNNVKRVVEEHNKGLQACKEKILQWEKFKSDYEALKKRLETLPDRLSYDVTVPFGPSAFMLGKLVNTNVITVLLGDNWFAEVSAKQAREIADRRIKQCLDTLDQLDKEKNQFESWLKYIDEVSTSEGYVEIKEEYNPEEEKLWKEQHAKNIKAYRQRLAEERKAQRTSSNSSIEDSENLLLDNLEIKDNGDYSDDSSQHSEESSHRSSLKLNIEACHRERIHSESETYGETEDDHREKDENDCNEECNNSGNHTKHVHWQDLSKNCKKITFRHSRSKNKHCPGTKMQEPKGDEDPNPIQSPSDIYKHFESFFQSSPPKSILKIKNSPTNDMQPPFFQVENESTESTPEVENDKVVEAFTGEICERTNPEKPTLRNNSARPTSHFRSSRKNRRLNRNS